MLPKTVALIDDDPEYSEFLAQYLTELGVQVDVFLDSNDLLVHPDPYRYDFYVVDLNLPGVDGVNLIKVLRLRTAVGILVVSGQLGPDVFASVMGAGADMYLAKPVQFEQVAIAVKAVQRRAGASTGAGITTWRLDRRAQQLLAPDGARVDLSEIDLAVVECFVSANGDTVTRDALRHRLGHGADSEADSLNATIYRLRRRIEKATPTTVPLQSKSRVGYVFRAPLQAV